MLLTAGCFAVACSSIPDVVYQDDASSPDANSSGDADLVDTGGGSDGGASDAPSSTPDGEGGTTFNGCPDQAPPNGVCCGSTPCFRCTAAQCDKCGRAACVSPLVCCGRGTGMGAIDCLSVCN